MASKSQFPTTLIDGCVEYAPGRFRKRQPVAQQEFADLPPGLPLRNRRLSLVTVKLNQGATTPAAPSTVGKTTGKWSPYRSRAECDFAAELRRRHGDALIEYEPMTWCIAADPAMSRTRFRFTPDFGVRVKDDYLGTTLYYEVKGGHAFAKDKYRLELACAFARRWGLNLYLASRASSTSQWTIERIAP